MLVVSVASYDVSDLLFGPYAGTVAQLREGGAIYCYRFCFVRAAEGSHGRPAPHLLIVTARGERQERFLGAIAPWEGWRPRIVIWPRLVSSVAFCREIWRCQRFPLWGEDCASKLVWIYGWQWAPFSIVWIEELSTLCARARRWFLRIVFAHFLGYCRVQAAAWRSIMILSLMSVL